jgi:hypothetical protein
MPCMYVCMYVMYVCMFVCHVCMYVCMSCMYVLCVYVRIHVCVYICMYVLVCMYICILFIACPITTVILHAYLLDFFAMLLIYKTLKEFIVHVYYPRLSYGIWLVNVLSAF